MSQLARREFLAAGFGLAMTGSLRAIEPIARPRPSHIKISLAAYSFHKLLERKKDVAPKMTMEEFIDHAASWGISAVELTSYYFADSTPAYFAGLKGRCTRLGLDVSGGAIGNNFCLKDPDKLRKEIEHVKQGADAISLLGGKTLRIFAGTLDKGDTEDAARPRVVEAIQEACDHAGKVGVYLALENHGGVTSTAEQILAIVKAVKHDWFGVNLDTGNFRTPDPHGDLVKVAPYAVTVQMKTETHPSGKPKEPANLPFVFEILRSARYSGHVALEYEAEPDPMIAVPSYLRQMQMLAVNGR
jgi:sugar phosphate isomerase/epimerase